MKNESSKTAGTVDRGIKANLNWKLYISNSQPIKHGRLKSS